MTVHTLHTLLLSVFILTYTCRINAQPNSVLPDIPFERNPNSTATWNEAITYYTKLSEVTKSFTCSPFGTTDSGHPLHEAVFSIDGDTDPASLRKKGRLIVLVLNAIHAGEPCGVDASMMLLRDCALRPDDFPWVQDVALVVIPVYNVGGALNRNSDSRVNQFGPESYGFRGNAKNLDLNRDFIKCDSKNAETFTQLFHKWQPDFLIDNHTSNGADYAHTMTLLATQTDKLTPPLGDWLTRFLPSVYAGMDSAGWPLTPYVNVSTTPDAGINGFLDLPRYSTGYASLFHTPGIMAEAHMLKPYPDRVQSAYDLMQVILSHLAEQKSELHDARKKALAYSLKQDTFAIDWVPDSARVDSVLFMGYEATYTPSRVSGLPRLSYDRAKPWTRKIPYFRYFTNSRSVTKPSGWLIPGAWDAVLERLHLNGIRMEQLNQDHIITAERYRIEDFSTLPAPWEGHYQHRNVVVSVDTVELQAKKGDVFVTADQPGLRYLIETLEPQAPDSWFCWNFFDPILSQKEYFSAYVFEDAASNILEANPALREALEQKKAEDPSFRQSSRAQLDFIYKQSVHYEQTHRAYPVLRVLDASDIEGSQGR
jgi:hypothetical protein